MRTKKIRFIPRLRAIRTKMARPSTVRLADALWETTKATRDCLVDYLQLNSPRHRGGGR